METLKNIISRSDIDGINTCLEGCVNEYRLAQKNPGNYSLFNAVTTIRELSNKYPEHMALIAASIGMSESNITHLSNESVGLEFLEKYSEYKQPPKESREVIPHHRNRVYHGWDTIAEK